MFCYTCHMISIADVVSDLVKTSPFLEEALSKNIISYSALARELKPQIEKKLSKEIKRGAVVMALKRTTQKLKLKDSTQKINSIGELTIRSNLTAITYINSDSMAEKQRILFSKIENKKEMFINVSQGIREITFIIGSDIAKELETVFKNEKFIAKVTGLSSITIRLPKESLVTPGFYYAILKLLAWEGINVVEVVSTYLELTIILANENIDKAFSVISSYQKSLS